MSRWVGMIALAIFFPPAAWTADLGAKVSAPEDLGPSVIDVSSYPEEYRKTYQDIFVPFFEFHGGAARAVNSPLIELDARLEEQERRENPELFQSPDIAQISRDGWKKEVQRFYRTPACCGACPVMTLKKARLLWRFLAYDSIRRKTGRQASQWVNLRKELLRRFRDASMTCKGAGK